MSTGLDIRTPSALACRSWFIGSFIGRYAY